MAAELHGTPTGARRHRRAGEQPCAECRDAERAYAAAYRNGPGKVGSKLRSLALGAARHQLVQLHLTEYQDLYRTELARLKKEHRP